MRGEGLTLWEMTRPLFLKRAIFARESSELPAPGGVRVRLSETSEQKYSFLLQANIGFKIQTLGARIPKKLVKVKVVKRNVQMLGDSGLFCF